MNQYVHLVGAEHVQSAANTMKEAAHEMSRAANTISEALRMNQIRTEQFLTELRDIMHPPGRTVEYKPGKLIKKEGETNDV